MKSSRIPSYAAAKPDFSIVEPTSGKSGCRYMTSHEHIEEAERELSEVKGLIDEQYRLITRLKRLGGDTQEAVRLLIDLLELQQSREQRLAQARIFRSRSARLR